MSGVLGAIANFFQGIINFVFTCVKIVGIGILIIIAIIILVFVIYKIREAIDDSHYRNVEVPNRINELGRFLFNAKDVNLIDNVLSVVEQYEDENDGDKPDTDASPEEKKEYKEYKANLAILNKIKDDDEFNSDFYRSYRDEIIQKASELLNSAAQDIEDKKKNALKQIQDDRKKSDEAEAQEETKDKVSRSVKELEKLSELLQDSVDKNGMLERADLRMLMKHLDFIVDNKSSINPDDKNNIERVRITVLDTFKRTKNLKDLKTNVDFVKKYLKEIC